MNRIIACLPAIALLSACATSQPTVLPASMPADEVIPTCEVVWPSDYLDPPSLVCDDGTDDLLPNGTHAWIYTREGLLEELP